MNVFARQFALAPLLLAACAGTPPLGAGGPPARPIAAPAPPAAVAGGVPAGDVGEAKAPEPRLPAATRAFPARVYTRDAVVTLLDPELKEDPAGLSLRVAMDVYLDGDRARYAGRATVPASRLAGAGGRALLDWRPAEARFEFDDAGAEPALIAAAGLALARQPARFCLDRCAGDAALRALAPLATPTPAAGPAGLAFGDAPVPLEQARAREQRRRAAVEARQRALTTDPRAVPPAASGRYFGRPGRLGPVLGLPGGLRRGGIGRR